MRVVVESEIDRVGFGIASAIIFIIVKWQKVTQLSSLTNLKQLQMVQVRQELPRQMVNLRQRPLARNRCSKWMQINRK